MMLRLLKYRSYLFVFVLVEFDFFQERLANMKMSGIRDCVIEGFFKVFIVRFDGSEIDV